MRKHLWTLCVVLVSCVFMMGWSNASIRRAQHNADSTAIKNGSGSRLSRAKVLYFHYLNDIYQTANLEESGLDSGVFKKAITGFYNLKIAGKLPAASSVVTIVDFNKSSCTKRMWIVDLQKKMLLLNTLVAHGQGSGDDMASNFSNNQDSHQSSIGFYVTDDIYIGKHGRSLRLDGMDEGFNDKARSRDIVLHAADYVSFTTINQIGRLGRSQGCPAVGPEVVDQVINTIKGKCVLFINGKASNYSSKYLNEDLAASNAFADSSYNLVKDVFNN